MCTASNYITKNQYFGRNFDYEISYNERVCITPRNYEFKFRKIDDMKSHFAIIGITAGIDEYPLYYDAMNEKGVAIAGLNFAGNAVYRGIEDDMVNVTPFEFIPYLLSQSESIEDVKELLLNLNLVNINYSENLPLSPLHWMIADENSSIIVEPLEDGLKVYDNPVGVLTNNPTFDYHIMNMNNYMGIWEGAARNTVCPEIPLENYSLGLGALGLPGDFSSASRFVKAVFVKE